MVEINTTSFQKRLHFLVVALLPIDGIFATIALVRSSCNDDVGTWHDFEGIGPRLDYPQTHTSDV